MGAKMQPAPGEDAALSYRRLRSMIGFVGLTLPITCLLAGIIDGHLELSISSYYYTKVTIVFTGTLCVVGVFLIAYRFGSLVFEDVATTVAGSASLGVALFHTAPSHDATVAQLRLSNVHMICAATLFVLLGIISLVVFPTDVPSNRARVANLYRGFGLLILGSIVAMPVLNRVMTPSSFESYHVFFILEAVCVMSFSLSFIAKGKGSFVDQEFDERGVGPGGAPVTTADASSVDSLVAIDGHRNQLPTSEPASAPRRTQEQLDLTLG